jgi:hypothetical protein
LACSEHRQLFDPAREASVRPIPNITRKSLYDRLLHNLQPLEITTDKQRGIPSFATGHCPSLSTTNRPFLLSHILYPTNVDNNPRRMRYCRRCFRWSVGIERNETLQGTSRRGRWKAILQGRIRAENEPTRGCAYPTTFVGSTRSNCRNIHKLTYRQ